VCKFFLQTSLNKKIAAIVGATLENAKRVSPSAAFFTLRSSLQQIFELSRHSDIERRFQHSIVRSSYGDWIARAGSAGLGMLFLSTAKGDCHGNEEKSC